MRAIYWTIVKKEDIYFGDNGEMSH